MFMTSGQRDAADRGYGRTALIAVLAMVVLVSGWLVSEAVAAGDGITEPTVVALSSTGSTDAGSRTYILRDTDGRRSGTISVFREPLLDADEHHVGNARVECTSAGHVAWFCTAIVTLHAGPFTQEGSVVYTGLFGGFNGEELAVTGGTGAYQNVRGYATLTVEGDLFIRTLYLIP
jgi:Dirigent-like protein